MARLGWPAMTCVCETARSAGCWSRPPGKSLCCLQPFPLLLSLFPPSAAQSLKAQPLVAILLLLGAAACWEAEDLSSFQSRSNRQSQQSVGNSAAAALALLADSSGTGRRRRDGVTGDDGAPSSHRHPNPLSRTPGTLTVMDYSVTPQKV